MHDHGPGIALEEQEELFRRYRRGSTAAGLGGLGLGLHVVREIVESHGGSVRVDARPGKGSTFTVELPLEPSAIGADEPSAMGSDEQSSSSPDANNNPYQPVTSATASATAARAPSSRSNPTG